MGGLRLTDRWTKTYPDGAPATLRLVLLNGQLYTFSWDLPEANGVLQPCPMHEEPLKLIPLDHRERVLHPGLGQIGNGSRHGYLCHHGLGLAG